MKTMKISEELHTNLKKYCNKNNLKMGKWVETILIEHFKNNNINYVINQ